MKLLQEFCVQNPHVFSTVFPWKSPMVFRVFPKHHHLSIVLHQHEFSMLFLSSSHVFPMFFPWFSHGFPSSDGCPICGARRRTWCWTPPTGRPWPNGRRASRCARHPRSPGRRCLGRSVDEVPRCPRSIAKLVNITLQGASPTYNLTYNQG